MSRVVIHVKQGGTTHDVVVRGGAVVVRQHLTRDAQVSDLFDRLQSALKRQGVTTQDDAEPGAEGHWLTINGAHVFVNGAGDITKGPAHLVGGNVKDHPTHKKIDVPAGGTKAKVHALLSAGHAFTMAELKDVLGGAPDKALANALAELKNPKYAGPKGALDIVKQPDGKYLVKPKAPGGLAVAPEPPAAPAIEPQAPTPAQPPSGTPEAPDPFANFKLKPDAPEEPDPDATEWEPGMSEEAKAIATVPLHQTAAGFIANMKPANYTAPGANAPKEMADAEYESGMGHLLENVQNAAKTLPADKAKEIALAFKQGKSNLMAEWASEVYNKDATAKPVEVFTADLKLVDNLATGMKPDEALAQWKADTKAEKLGVLDKPAAAVPPLVTPKPAAPAAPVVPTAAAKPHFEKVTNYVPDDHKGITAADIGTGSVFQKEITKLKSKLVGASKDAGQNKADIATTLGGALKESAAFQHLKKLYPGSDSGISSLESQLIQAWAGSSGGNNPTSNAAQLIIRDAFGMGKDDVSYDALHVYHQNGKNDDAVYMAAMSHLSFKSKTPADLAAFKAGMHDFALAQYHNTQARFKELGITHVHVSRGMSTTASAQASEVDLKLQPASSFSTNYGTAKGFSGGQAIYHVKVPVSQVLGSYLTGYGCTNEHEVVVLAHPKTAAIEQKVGGYSGGATTLTEAMAHMDKHLAGAGANTKKAGSGYIGPKPTMNPIDLNDLSPVGANKITAAETLYNEGDLTNLKKLHAEHVANSGAKVIGNHMKELADHLEKMQGAGAVTSKPSVPDGYEDSYSVANAQKMHAAGNLQGLKEYQAEHKEDGGDTLVNEYIGELAKHLEFQQGTPPVKVTAAKFKPEPPPKKPGSVKSIYAKAAYAAAKKMDLAGVEAALDTLKTNYFGTMMTASKNYVPKLVEHVKQQLAAKAVHEQAQAAAKAAAKATKAPKKMAMHGTTPVPSGGAPAPHKVVGYAPGIPSHHLNHPHFNMTQYQNWQEQGKTEFQIGKTLAAIKFAAKKKEQAALGPA